MTRQNLISPNVDNNDTEVPLNKENSKLEAVVEVYQHFEDIIDTEDNTGEDPDIDIHKIVKRGMLERCLTLKIVGTSELLAYFLL